MDHDISLVYLSACYATLPLVMILLPRILSEMACLYVVISVGFNLILSTINNEFHSGKCEYIEPNLSIYTLSSNKNTPPSPSEQRHGTHNRKDGEGDYAYLVFAPGR